MCDLTGYIHNQLTRLSIRNTVIRDGKAIAIELDDPLCHRIELDISSKPHLWKFQFYTDDPIIHFSSDTARYILDKQMQFRVFQATNRTDEGLDVFIENDSIRCDTNYEGRFNILVQVPDNQYVLYRKPFIDYWKYILMGLEKFA